MPLKNFPWVSFTLLLVTHSIVGWQLSTVLDWKVSSINGFWLPWVAVVIADLLLAVALSTPWVEVKHDFAGLFKSDGRTFGVAVILAFLSVVIITWLHVFVHILVVVAAGTLFNLDAYTARWTHRQSFCLLVVISLIGLGIGALVQSAMQAYLGG